MHSPGISAWVHCITIKPLCLFIPLLSTLIIPSSRTKALVLASPDRRRSGVQTWNSLSLLGRSSSAILCWALSRTWNAMCMCGRRAWTSNLREGPGANVRRLDLLSMLILPSRNFSEPVHTRTFLHQALPHTQEQTACIVLLKVLD